MATQRTATTQFITANGTEFAYRLIGKPTGNLPVLLLNHIRGTIDTWDPLLVNTLGADRLVITYDYSGIGWSSGVVALSITEMAKDVKSFIKAILPNLPQQTDKIDVLGFSMGGFVTQLLAKYELVNRLIIAGSTASFFPGMQCGPVEILLLATAPEPVPEFVANVFFPPTPDGKAAASAWWTRVGERAIAVKEHGKEFKGLVTDPEKLARLLEAYQTWYSDSTPWAGLGLVQNEVLVAAGRSDLLIPAQNAVEIGYRIPNATTIIYPLSGHGFVFQFATLFAQHVGEFLDGKWGKSEN